MAMALGRYSSSSVFGNSFTASPGVVPSGSLKGSVLWGSSSLTGVRMQL